MQSLRSWAYPRSRGATELSPMLAGRVGGLSPLARGNLGQCAVCDGNLGPIPARAGQPGAAHWRGRCRRAYPRSRGATNTRRRIMQRDKGLSPLARGNPSAMVKRMGYARPIPARAGQPRQCAGVRQCAGAYPRSRGATRPIAEGIAGTEGLSPLARGNQVQSSSCARKHGPIPARAGQPAQASHHGTH